MALILALGCTAAVPAVAQDDHRDRQQNQEMRRDRDDNRGESSYQNNPYYQQGWKNGQRHKHKNRKWKNDSDRQAYEAGYAHGDRGEQWQNANRQNDRNRGGDHDHQ